MFASTIPDLDRRPGAPAILRTAADDPVGWAAEHRDALRAAVAEHGALLVRGLGLWDRAQVGAVFRRLADELMTEREAFAPRERHPEGTYSSTAVAGQPAHVHAPRTELHPRRPRPDAVRLPDRATRGWGDRTGRRADRARGAARRAGGAVRARGVAAHPQLQRRDRGVVRRGVRHGGPCGRRAVLPGQHDRDSRGRPTAGCAPGSVAPPWCATRSPAGAAGSTRSPSSASGRSTPRCATTWSRSTATTRCRSTPASATATRSARTWWRC